MTPLIDELKRRRQWRGSQVGRLELMLVRARDVYEAAASLADRGLFVRERARQTDVALAMHPSGYQSRFTGSGAG